MSGSENSKLARDYTVYILESLKSGELYVGFTTDLKSRLETHNSGLNFSTKSARPWRIIFYEVYLNQKDAIRRERYLKTSQGSRLLKRMLKEYFYNKKVEVEKLIRISTT